MKEREPWSPLLTLALIALVLIAVPWTFKLATAPALGEPCGNGFDCAALQGRCIQGKDVQFCTITCDDDSQCPSTGHCGIPPYDRWQRWFSSSVMSERFCVPGPRPATPLEIPEGIPGAGEAQFRPPEQGGATSRKPR
jgi:hypothetical protein